MKLCGQKSEPQETSIYDFSKIIICNIYVSKYKITLLEIYPNLPSYKALSGSTIYEMKVWLNIDSVFKLFCLKKNTMTQCLL